MSQKKENNLFVRRKAKALFKFAEVICLKILPFRPFVKVNGSSLTFTLTITPK